jgi:hypothetical protein
MAKFRTLPGKRMARLAQAGRTMKALSGWKKLVKAKTKKASKRRVLKYKRKFVPRAPRAPRINFRRTLMRNRKYPGYNMKKALKTRRALKPVLGLNRSQTHYFKVLLARKVGSDAAFALAKAL